MALRDPKIRIAAEDRTRAAFASAGRNVNDLTGRLGGLRSTLVGIAGAAGFGAVIKSAADTGDQIQKLSISLGASTESLSQYRLLAEASGTSLESLSLIWQRQTRRVAEAAAGYGESRAALRELNLDVRELNKLAPDEQFEAIAREISKVENSADRLRIAFKLFDSEGARPALQIIESAKGDFEAWREEADRLGLTLSRTEADAMAAFNDRLTKTRLVVTAATERLTVALIPVLETVAEKFAAAAAAGLDFWKKITGGENTAVGQAERNLERIQDKLDLERGRLAALERGDIIAKIFGDENELKASIRSLELAENSAALVVSRLREKAGIFDDETRGAPGGGGGLDLTGAGADPAAAAAEKAALERAEREEQRLREGMARKLEVIRQSTLTEQELLAETHEEKMFFLEEAYQNELIGFQELQDRKVEIEEQYQAKVADLKKKEITTWQNIDKKGRLEQSKFLSGQLNSNLALVSKHNKALFTIQKVSAISEATIATYQGAAQALRDVPYPWNIAAAALVVANGIGQVAQIASTSYGSQASGGGSAPAPVYQSDPTFGLPETTQAPTVAQDITVSIGDDDGLLSAGTVRNLIEAINDQIDDGVVINSIVVA